MHAFFIVIFFCEIFLICYLHSLPFIVYLGVFLWWLIDMFTFEYWPVSQPQTDESLVILLQYLHRTVLCQVQDLYCSTIQGQFIKDFYIKLQKIKWWTMTCLIIQSKVSQEFFCIYMMKFSWTQSNLSSFFTCIYTLKLGLFLHKSKH